MFSGVFVTPSFSELFDGLFEPADAAFLLPLLLPLLTKAPSIEMIGIIEMPVQEKR